MPTTDLHGWATPDGSEQPQVHLDMEALADSIDADVPVVNASAPPHRDGRLWYNPTTDVMSTSDGSAWSKLVSGLSKLSCGTGSGVTDANGYMPIVNHNLGGTPDFVVITMTPGGSDTVSALQKSFVSSITSTAFQIRVSRTDTNAWFTGNGFGYFWIAGRV